MRGLGRKLKRNPFLSVPGPGACTSSFTQPRWGRSRSQARAQPSHSALQERSWSWRLGQPPQNPTGSRADFKGAGAHPARPLSAVHVRAVRPGCLSSLLPARLPTRRTTPHLSEPGSPASWGPPLRVEGPAPAEPRRARPGRAPRSTPSMRRVGTRRSLPAPRKSALPGFLSCRRGKEKKESI